MRLLFTVLILFLSSCTPSKITKYPLPEQYSKGEPIRIDVLGNMYGNMYNFELSQNTIYNSLYKDTEIVIHPYDSQSLVQKLETDFAIGQAPDIFVVWPDTLISNLIENDMILDLTYYLNSDKKWYSSFKYKQLWEPLMSEKKIYGLPVEVITENLIINNAIFKELELDPPESYEDLLDLSLKLHEHDILLFDISNWLDLSYLYQAIIIMVKSNRPNIDPYIDALYLLMELYNRKAFILDQLFAEEFLYSGSLFTKKRAAIIVNGSWLIGRIYTEMEGDITLKPIPGLSPLYNKSLIFGLGSMTYYISNKPTRSDNELREIIHYMKYLTSSIRIEKTLEDIFFISNIKVDDINNVTLESFIKEVDHYHSPPDHDFNRDIWNNKILYKIPDMLNGSLTPEELWKDVPIL